MLVSEWLYFSLDPGKLFFLLLYTVFFMVCGHQTFFDLYSKCLIFKLSIRTNGQKISSIIFQVCLMILRQCPNLPGAQQNAAYIVATTGKCFLCWCSWSLSPKTVSHPFSLLHMMYSYCSLFHQWSLPHNCQCWGDWCSLNWLIIETGTVLVDWSGRLMQSKLTDHWDWCRFKWLTRETDAV